MQREGVLQEEAHGQVLHRNAGDWAAGVLSIASAMWEQVSNGAWEASEFTLELRQVARLQEQGLAPEPEPAENKIHDISAHARG